MASDEQDADAAMIAVERCPICGTLMTAEQAGPIRLVNPAHRMVIADVSVGEGQSVTRMRCENGHTFWAIEDEEDGDEQES
jgi:hypothetical protein